MTTTPTLDTPRLRLRPYRIEDFERYAAMWAEPAVVRFIGGLPMSREAAWIRFLRQIGIWHYLGFGFFALEDRESGAFLRGFTTSTAPWRRQSKARWRRAGLL